MSEQTGQQLAAALRAQASGVRPQARNEPPSAGVRGWVLLASAVLLGAVAGALAALLSTL